MYFQTLAYSDQVFLFAKGCDRYLTSYVIQHYTSSESPNTSLSSRTRLRSVQAATIIEPS